MATRGMLFVDGTWTGVQAVRLGELRGAVRRPGGPVDFGALPRVCASRIAAQMDVGANIDLVRSYYFGAIATNHDPQDDDVVQRRRDFYDALRREHRYQHVRDFNTIWLDDIWPEIEVQQERPIERPIERPVIRPIERETTRASTRTVSVASPYDDWADPFGPPQLSSSSAELLSTPSAAAESTSTRSHGVVIKVHPKQYAFVRGDDGLDYFFHRKAMANPEAFPALLEQRSRVSFLVDATPSSMQAGRGGHVELLAEHHE